MTDLKFDASARVGIGDPTPSAALHIEGNPPDIDQMPAGPEMDALIAEVVMGWPVIRMDNGAIVIVEIGDSGQAYAWTYNPGDDHHVGFKPSTDLVDSRQVLDRIVELCPSLLMDWTASGLTGAARHLFSLSAGVDGWAASAYGTTETLALCRAAYKAMKYIGGK
jgi:hypothetical protein